MKTGFPGFPAEGLKFLSALKKNNKREWFQPRKQIFDEKVKAPMVELVAALMEDARSFAPDYTGDPAKAVFRIYRDTRFSKDKTPYKTNIAASLKHRDAVKNNYSGFYVSVSAEGVEVGGGVYMPMPPDLLAMRTYVAVQHEELRKMLASRQIRQLMGELWGDRMSRAPRGFPADHPAADLIACKQYILFTTLDAGIATTSSLYREVSKRFKIMAPFVEFLNRPLLSGQSLKARMKALGEV